MLKYLSELLLRLLVIIIVAYQKSLSLLLGPRCRFYPSCSEYAKSVLKTHGFMRAIWLTGKRLLKCHPWHPGGVDLPPEG